MFSTARMFLFAASAAVIAPAAASAVTIDYNVTADVNYSYAEVISPGGEYEFRFTVLEDLVISAFALAATGTGDTDQIAVDDVSNIRFGFTDPATEAFANVMSFGKAATGSAFLPGGTFSAGDVFSIFFQDGIVNKVSLGLSFNTEMVPVPLPAAGMLLAPVLLAGGAAAIRRRKAIATKA